MPNADRSLGAKQESLTIVHFLDKLIVFVYGLGYSSLFYAPGEFFVRLWTLIFLIVQWNWGNRRSSMDLWYIIE
jgi:hypothetical protein